MKYCWQWAISSIGLRSIMAVILRSILARVPFLISALPMTATRILAILRWPLRGVVAGICPFMAGSGCMTMISLVVLRQAVGGDEACHLGLQIRLPCWHKMRRLPMLPLV